jgi:hypothetical protein
MKRGRKPKDDSAEFLEIRAALACGSSLKEACRKIWEQHGRTGPTPEQRRKRYEQFQSHYAWFDPKAVRVYDRRSLLLRMFAKPGLQRIYGATLVLSRRAANKKARAVH